MTLQDKNVVRTAADLEKKYNFAKILGLSVNVEATKEQLIKVENELNNMLNSLIINLGDLLDTQSGISLWFYEGIPTTSNEPYTDWVTPADHYGDFYYDQNSGYVYKFTQNGWELQDDTNLINAMALTNVELDVSTDHERKVYFQQPTPPYWNGDWWILEDGTLMICQISKPSGEVYEEFDFIVSNRYVQTIAVKQNNTLTVLKGTVTEITEDYVKFTDLATGGSTTIAGENISTGSIKSNNYVADTSGTKIDLSNGAIDSKNFKVNNTGEITATNANVTGTITSTNGSIGGYQIYSGKLKTSDGKTGISSSSYSTDPAFWAGYGDPWEHQDWYTNTPFFVTHDGHLKATDAEITGAITATSGSFSGTITAGSGTIAGWSIGAGSFSKQVGDYSFEIRTDRPSNDAALLVYKNYGSDQGYKFYVRPDGYLFAVNADITGTIHATSGSFTGSVTATSGTFTGTIHASSGNIGGWTINSSGITGTYSGTTVTLTPRGFHVDTGSTNWWRNWSQL